MSPKLTVSGASFLHSDDLGIPVETLDERVLDRRADRPGERQEAVVVEMALVADEHDQVVEPGPSDLSDDLVVEVAGEIEHLRQALDDIVRRWIDEFDTVAELDRALAP